MDLDFPVKFKLRVSITRLLSNALGVEVGGFGGEDILKRQTREKKKKGYRGKSKKQQQTRIGPTGLESSQLGLFPVNRGGIE